MKKKVIGFAVFGVTLAIVGGVGAATNFHKAEKQSLTAIEEHYTVQKNDKKLEIAVTGDIRYHFSESKDQEIHISGKAHSVASEQAFTWKPSESGDKTTIKVDFTETGNYKDYLQLGFSQYVEISIPTSFETVTVNSTKSSRVDISTLKTKDLVFSTDSPEYSNLSNLRLDNLTVKAQFGHVNLAEISAKKMVTLTGDHGSFSLNNSRAEIFAVQSTDGYLELNDLVGNSRVQTDRGFVRLTGLKGETLVETLDGNIDWDYSKLTDNLTVKTSDGDIRVNLERQPSNFSIVTKQTTGTVSLFGKEKKSLTKGSGGPLLTLESLHGDIRVYDDESEYGESDENFIDVEDSISDAIQENL